jgi:predicted negative regulator of RcsB-dependent stress response
VDENLTDQQRAEQLRSWLRDNGWYLLAGLVLGLGALLGWREWQGYTTAEAEAASALYEDLLVAIRVDRTARAEELTQQLAAEHAASPYLDQARLAMARLKMDRSDLDAAAAYLRQVAGGSDSAELASIARLRLARVLIQQEKYDEALRILDTPGDSAFASRFHEVRGDAYYAMGKPAEAREQYAAALEGSEATAADQAFLRAKLDEVSGLAPPLDSSAAAAPPGE